jgi:hypothetical protein
MGAALFLEDFPNGLLDEEIIQDRATMADPTVDMDLTHQSATMAGQTADMDLTHQTASKMMNILVGPALRILTGKGPVEHGPADHSMMMVTSIPLIPPPMARHSIPRMKLVLMKVWSICLPATRMQSKNYGI